MSGPGFTNSVTNPGCIINRDNPQPSVHAHAHADDPSQHRIPQSSSLQQYGQQQYFNTVNSVAPFNSNVNAYHRATVPALPETSPTFTLDGIHPYAAIPPGPLVNQSIGATPGATGPTDLSHRFNWDSTPGHLSQQKGERIEASQGLTTGLASGTSDQPDMRYLTGSLDVLSAEQYDDGRYSNHRHLSKHNAHLLTKPGSAPNPKKRGRKISQNEQTESVEEIKRARGRPRLETGGHQDMKERRKEQIRLAQRAYRSRKETAISDLEARVAELEASKDMINREYKALLLEYADKHAISAVIPELGRRLQQFQNVLIKKSEPASPGSEDQLSDVKSSDPLEAGIMPVESKLAGRSSTSRAVSSPPMQQAEQLLGGIIVTHEPEPEPESMAHESSVLPPSLENEDYTVVRLPSETNSSYRFNMDFLDSPMPDQWPLNLQSLGMPSSGAHLESTLGRKLHRRAIENAARLLALENPPYEVMHRAFGFVRNYATLDEIRQRVNKTLSRKSDEDLNVYTQPFHNMGGSGTHYFNDTKVVPYSSGAPFPSTGFGMGPFNERTMRVRDDFLDALQHTQFPGWQGDWLDPYDVQRLLAQRLVTLPQGGEGFVDIPPGDFYHNPLEGKAPSPRMSDLQMSLSRKSTSDFNLPPSPSNAAPIPAAGHGRYPPTLSSIDTMLSTPVTADMWPPSTTMGVDFLGQAQTLATSTPSTMSFDNSLAFSDSPQILYPPSTLNFEAGYPPVKRVWFSLNKFIERLGSKGTCAGRGPAFRKRDVVIAFWEAVSLEAE